MMNLKRAAIIAGIVLIAPLATAAAASATNHVDPCPGQHVQVWAEVGNNGAGQATDHFVCNTPGSKGDPGKDGKDGIDGKDGAKGDTGADGKDGVGTAGTPGAPGAVGAAGPAGLDGSPGAVGAAGADGVPGAPGVDGSVGPAGPQGTQGVDGETFRGAKGDAGVTTTKYVYVNADGSETPAAVLPHTGMGGEWQLALVGLALLGTGAYIVVQLRK